MPKFEDQEDHEEANYPFLEADEYGSIPNDDSVEFISLHELLTYLDGKQQ